MPSKTKGARCWRRDIGRSWKGCCLVPVLQFRRQRNNRDGAAPSARLTGKISDLSACVCVVRCRIKSDWKTGVCCSEHKVFHFIDRLRWIIQTIIVIIWLSSSIPLIIHKIQIDSTVNRRLCINTLRLVLLTGIAFNPLNKCWRYKLGSIKH